MNHFMSSAFLKLFGCIILCLISQIDLSAQSIKGYVFIDSNHNSVMDPDEKGLEGVKVSNQRDVQLTDQNGAFEIKLIEGNFVFITKPEGYQFKLDQYNNPEFYFFYKTKRTRDELLYSAADPISEVPEILYFPVYNNPGEEEHSCLMVGDIQMKDDEELGYYQEGILPFMATKGADFYVLLGDIADDNLNILSKERSVTATMGIPGYRIVGNHDINRRASDNKASAETFKRILGPEYYSFDYGNIHYIVVNNIHYEGWWKEVNAPGDYNAGLSSEQLKWLENDLLLVPSDKIIVLFSHIPIHASLMDTKFIRSIFKTLENHQKILAVSGHLHSITAFDYAPRHGWKSSGAFEALVAGAASGAWWTGVMDENNIPYSTCLDGSPKGFFQLNSTPNDYYYIFHPVNYPIDSQLRTYVKDEEIWVNWFVGKKTDSVHVYVNNSDQAILLQNYIDKDPYMVELLDENDFIKRQIGEVSNTGHLWKVKLPDDLEPGHHSVRVVAKDSKGKLFTGFKTFLIE